MSAASFFAELKRRNVLRAAAFYAASAWLIVQVATQVFPFFDIANWVVRWIVVAAAIGFPFAMLSAWFYQWTPRGIQREGENVLDESIARQTGKKIDRWIIAVLSFAVVLLLANTFVLHNDANTASANLRAASTSGPAPDKSIAVLPLANESGDKDQQYFSDGLSEDLITALSQLAGLKVISRNSSFQFRNTTESSKTIGDKLGVVHLLEGSVRRAGDMVRISAELVNAADGSTLWSQRYDRPYKDLFALQDDITSAVAAALKAKLLTQAGAVAQSERPPGGNLAAWNAYSQGKFFGRIGTPDDARKATDFYTQATLLDPHYARAYAALADTWTILAGTFLSGDDARHAYAEARTAVDRALQLDADVAAAHDARGLLLEWVDFDFNGAQEEFQRALELAPNDATTSFRTGALLGTLGQARQATELIRQSIALDPRNGGSWYWLGWNLAALGQLEDAEQAVHKAVALAPRSTFVAAGLVIMQVRRGQFAAALASAQQQPAGLWRDFSLALALQMSDDRAAADAALKSLIAGNADGMPYQIAEIYALRKDPDNTFAWLDRAWAARDPGIGRLLSDPFILQFKDDARFAAFCRKVGLPPPANARPGAALLPVAAKPGSAT